MRLPPRRKTWPMQVSIVVMIRSKKHSIVYSRYAKDALLAPGDPE